MPTQSLDIQLGSSCPDFNLKGTDGKFHRLSDYASSPVLVVGFTCNHCPYVKAYEDRIANLAKNYKAKGVSVVCINANDVSKYPDDSMEKMMLRAKEKDFTFDYLQDETQEIARAFNAACTPEFYIYDAKRALQYHGRLDDNANEPSQVKERYMEDAINSLLTNQKPKLQKTHALGCGIKWKL